LILSGILILSALNCSLWLFLTQSDPHTPGIAFGFGGLSPRTTVPLNRNFNISAVAFQESFSACLLIKDDNEILSEWLAYHYYAMNLRYLVVAVDPTSHTSPSAILDIWKAHTDLRIMIWTDEAYMPESFKGEQIRRRFVRNGRWHEDREDDEQVQQDVLRISNHRYRQLMFVSSCFRHMRVENRTFVAHIDTDEYVTLNPMLRYRTQYRERPMPSLAHPGVISSFVEQVIYQDEFLFEKANFPCLSMPRLLFGSVDDDAGRLLDLSFGRPSGWLMNSSRFETLRWMYHAAFNDTNRNAQPKVLVDVRLVPPGDQMFEKAFSIHRPSKALCRYLDQMQVTGFQRYPLTVQHYVGSLERYLGRNDSRRSERIYHEKAHAREGGRDAWISAWLSGFVKAMGETKARILLEPNS
jgi:hypothetical protein